VHSPADRSRLDELDDWTRRELIAKRELLSQRAAHGRIRDATATCTSATSCCWTGAPTLFDAIEFNPELRCIDVISDISFTFMDLADHGLEGLAWRCLSRYLEISGDYGGLRVAAALCGLPGTRPRESSADPAAPARGETPRCGCANTHRSSITCAGRTSAPVR